MVIFFLPNTSKRISPYIVSVRGEKSMCASAHRKINKQFHRIICKKYYFIINDEIQKLLIHQFFQPLNWSGIKQSIKFNFNPSVEF